MIIKPIGQSGYIIKTENTEILIDPYLSDIVNKYEDMPRMLPCPIKPEEVKADAIICTHNHLDHLDLGAVPLIRKEQLYITTNDGKEKLKALDRENVIALSIGESTTVGDFSIAAVYAKHTVEAFGVILKAEGKTLYFSGDTLFDEKLFELSRYNPDIAFICINGRLGNMNVQEAVTVANKINAKHSVPNHYDMFASNSENPDKFISCVKNSFIMNFMEEYNI